MIKRILAGTKKRPCKGCADKSPCGGCNEKRKQVFKIPKTQNVYTSHVKAVGEAGKINTKGS